MEYNNIIFEQDELGIGRITLNQPDSLNALGTAMAKEMTSALKKAQADKDVKVIIITGAGRAFSAGGDMKYMEKGLDVIAARDYVITVSEVTKLIFNMEKPVIAVVNGFAVGAGFNLAMAADFVIASSNAKFGQAFLQVGLIPDIGGTYFLPRAVGLQKAKELVFTGKLIDAPEAERIGLVGKVVNVDDLQEEGYNFAIQLAQGPTYAMGLAKSLLNRSLDRDLDDVIQEEIYSQSICMQTKDHREGVSAFIEKRKPKFIGE